MAAGFYDVFMQLQGSGFYEFLLPFLLMFTVVFAILEETKLFGTDDDGHSRKNINAVIALILGLLITSQFEVVAKLQYFLPRISLYIIISLMVLILIGLFAGDIRHGFGGVLLILVSLIALVLTFAALAPLMGFEVTYWLQQNWQTLLVIIIILIIIFAVIKSGGGSNGGGTSFSDAMKAIDTMFGKPDRNGGKP